ncbi:hypothetical protein FLAG1_07679 [Fusarium langsethiae]|uniref:Uncharacterized protein n=1 Tax=Fusarium langsethiae TaxID=179993 RepID=A0A0M9ETB0_FUSLA|nr:hypothetical protein FLAG1_07679 [Fusarium langsethiae]
MTYELTQEQGISIYPPLIPIVPFMSSDSVPQPNLDHATGYPVSHYQDTAQIAYGSGLSTTGNTILGYSSVPECAPNLCPYGNHSCPGKGWCSLLHPIYTFINYNSIPELTLDAAPSLSSQSSTESIPATRPGIESYESVMSRLEPNEQYVVDMKLRGKTYEEIRKGYKWKHFKSASSINAILNELRERHDVISQLLPAKQYKLRSPKYRKKANPVVGIVPDVYGQQNYQGF